MTPFQKPTVPDATDHRPARTVERFEAIADSSYTVGFSLDSAPQERLLMPRVAAESRGIEDVRMVQLDPGDGSGRQHVGTYTGHDRRYVRVRMPRTDERSGYMPDVVYSCGGMRHGRTLVLPYGCSDTASRIAMVDLDALVGELVTEGPGPTG